MPALSLYISFSVHIQPGSVLTERKPAFTHCGQSDNDGKSTLVINPAISRWLQPPPPSPGGSTPCKLCLGNICALKSAFNYSSQQLGNIGIILGKSTSVIVIIHLLRSAIL